MQLRDGARVAIYARYSSTMQSPRSIQDQMALCRRRILDGAGVGEISTYADRAESATSLHDLHGLQRLLRDVGEGRIDIVCAEALDRLSRNLADLASLYERLRFEEVELVTVEEGVISPMHVGLKGLMNQDFVAVLAAKTRRGMEGAVREGRAAGGLSYGYRVVRRVDEDGQVLRGLREIDPLQAEIVRRIFRWYADGRSPRWIAGQLNAEGVPAPRGGLWKAVTINGNRSRRNGVLNNDLYRGQLLFGRTASRGIRPRGGGGRAPYRRRSGRQFPCRICASWTKISGRSCSFGARQVTIGGAAADRKRSARSRRCFVAGCAAAA